LRPIRIIKSEIFRHAVLFALLFLVLSGVLIGAVLWIVHDTQEASLIRANDADIATVINGFRDEGIDEAVEVVRQRLGSPKYSRIEARDCYMLLQSDRGGKLAGNLPLLPRRLGIFTVGLDPLQLLGRGVEIAPGIHLFVGRSTADISETRQRILHAFGWIVLGATIIAVIVGMFLGTRFTRRVDAIARTCKELAAGRWDERIPSSGRGDEWDRLSGAINDMLNRIAALVDNLRQVSSDVAHDLRTPLTRMRNRLEEARARSAGSSGDSAVIVDAIDDTDQLLSMFEALLRISQVEAGTRTRTFAALSLSELCEKVFQMYLPVAEDSGRSLTSSIVQGAFVLGDAELLTQMLANLIENAIRHTPQRAHIRLSLDVAGDRVTVSVRDDGPGIPATEHEKVLRRFYRVSNSRSTAGHGLGLALVAAIAQLHHAPLTLSDAVPGLEVAIEFERRPAA
jgi:signal transduction histidine kinase